MILPIDDAPTQGEDLPDMGESFAAMLAATGPLEPIATAVVHPCDESSLEGALAAQEHGLITPILVGPTARIHEAAEEAGVDISDLEIVDSEHSHDSAKKAVQLVHQGRAQALMKGALHTDEVMGEVVHKERGLRTERRMSHVFVLDVPHLSQTAPDFRRGHQHLSRPANQGRHHPERHRPGPCPWCRPAQGRDPFGG